MSISVLSRTRLFASVMVVAVFSALVLVGCGGGDDYDDDNPSGGGGTPAEVNGTYQSSLPPGNGNGLGISNSYISTATWYLVTIVVSDHRTVKITAPDADVDLTLTILDGKLKLEEMEWQGTTTFYQKGKFVEGEGEYNEVTFVSRNNKEDPKIRGEVAVGGKTYKFFAER